MAKKLKEIFFDMDGTLVDLYSDPLWLDKLMNEDISLFKKAKIMIEMKEFKKALCDLKKLGCKIGVISWTPLNATRTYAKKVCDEKEKCLKKMGIKFDDIYITHYGNVKNNFASRGDILFDDNKQIRKEWQKIGIAYDEKNIIETLNEMIKEIKKENGKRV